MTILCFTHYTALYGANKSLINLLDGLQEYNIRPILVLPYKGLLEQELIARNIKYFVLPYYITTIPIKNSRLKGFIFGIIKNLINLFVHFKLLFLLKKHKISPDVVHSNSSVIDAGFIFSQLIQRPHIWHIREFREKHYQMHHCFGENFFYFLLKKSDIVITISEAIQNYIHRNLPSKNTHLLPDGILSLKNKPNFIQNQAISPKKEIVFAIIGYIHPAKGQLAAIEAFNILKQSISNIKLLIIGSAEFEEEYLAKIKNKITPISQNSIELAGFIQDMDKIYPSIDFVLVCSDYEALGRVSIEAMSKNIPVIGKKGNGTSEIITHLETGILYENDAQDLSEKMKWVIENTASIEKIKRQAAQFVWQKYTIEAYTQKFVDLLNPKYSS